MKGRHPCEAYFLDTRKTRQKKEKRDRSLITESRQSLGRQSPCQVFHGVVHEFLTFRWVCQEGKFIGELI